MHIERIALGVSFKRHMYFIPDRAKINSRNFPSVSSGTAFVVLEIQAAKAVTYVAELHVYSMSYNLGGNW